MYATVLGCDLAIVDKRRQSGTEVSVKNLIGDVDGRTVLMFDDMISTAGTVCEAARLVDENGATDVVVSATHPVLVGNGHGADRRQPHLPGQRLRHDPRRRPATARSRTRVTVLSVAKLLGEAVHRIHHDQSVSAMFRTGVGTKR